MGRPRKLFTKYPRRSAKGNGDLFVLVIYLGIAGLIFSALKAAFEFITSPTGAVITGVAVAIVLFFTITAQIKKNKLQAEADLAENERQDLLDIELGRVQVSHNRADYLIEQNDYKRGNTKENLYKKTFLLPLLSVYENKCAKCKSDSNGLDIDHFYLSKNDGGNFIMRHQRGHLVNNAVPLCQTCNRSKGDQFFEQFFDKEELLVLFNKNVVMTKKLNEANLIDGDGQVIKASRKKLAA